MESEGRGKVLYKRQNLSEHEAAEKSWDRGRKRDLRLGKLRCCGNCRRQVDEVEVFGMFGGDLPASIGADNRKTKRLGRPSEQYSDTMTMWRSYSEIRRPEPVA
jgi:hypothetical protein